MKSALHVTKRDGRREAIDLDKIHKIVDWAAAGLDKVSVSEVELRTHLIFFTTSSVIITCFLPNALLKYLDPLTALGNLKCNGYSKLYLAIPNNRSPPIKTSII